MGKRPGMILYHDKYAALQTLGNDDFRTVIDALMHTSMTGEPVVLDGYLGVIYGLMATSLDADKERYEQTIERRREAGRRSGEIRRQMSQQREQTGTKRTNAHFVQTNEQNELTNTNQTNTNQTNTNQTNTNQNVDNSLSPNLSLTGDGEERREPQIPTIDQVREYARAAGLRVDAEAFYRENRLNGWKDAQGRPIRDWRVWLQGYAAKHPAPRYDMEDERIQKAFNLI